MSTLGELKVALVHDELIRRGGAEIVFEEFMRIFPQADVYALYAGNNPYITVNEKRYPIHTSFLQKLPLYFRRHPGRMLPLLPQAAEQFDLSQYDVVISSASGFAKAVITRSTIPHICYCHTPTRYLWDESLAAAQRRLPGIRQMYKLLTHFMRMADYAAAQRPDVFIANSHYTQQRITKVYRRESSVVYPPIDTTFFTPDLTFAFQDDTKRPFLVVSRLSPAKHIEQAITVCEKLGLPLVVVGVGSEHARLSRFVKKHTRLVGKVSREELRTYYRSARALLQPGVEDFGMAAAESLACGTPVIAYERGGVQEIVTSGKHGVLYAEQAPEALAEAIRLFTAKEGDFTPEVLQQQVLRFSTARFRREIEAKVNDVVFHSKAEPKTVG